jgi:hypothetical protein
MRMITDSNLPPAERRSEREGNGASDQADLDGQAQAVQDGRQHVAALRVGAKEVSGSFCIHMPWRLARVHQSQACEVIGVLR